VNADASLRKQACGKTASARHPAGFQTENHLAKMVGEMDVKKNCTQCPFGSFLE